jgi:hypothetical protein
MVNVVLAAYLENGQLLFSVQEIAQKPSQKNV